MDTEWHLLARDAAMAGRAGTATVTRRDTDTRVESDGMLGLFW